MADFTNHRAREQLLHLLVEAAELEHNLLCCYLYAVFSLKRSTAEDLHDAELDAVERWRKAIMEVAQEEMVHLVLVSNMLVALGSRPHFNRPNFPVAPGYHPAAIVVALAPFDEETLDHFIFLERPASEPVPDAEKFTPDEHYTRGAPHAALMPGACDYTTIGEFYGAIRDSFIDVAADMGERNLFSGDAAMQISHEVASMPGVAVITDLKSALAALDTIVVQGEGADVEADDSHYERFRQIKSEYQALVSARPEFTPARPAAHNPVMRKPVAGDGRVHVNATEAAAVLDVANATYNHMLRLLTQAFGRTQPCAEDQGALLDAAITSMGIFARVAEHLTTLRASDAEPHVHAGVSFAMLRSTEPLVENAREWTALGERFDELADGLRRAWPDATAARLAGTLDGLARKFRERTSA
jgi:hypothetical protein